MVRKTVKEKIDALSVSAKQKIEDSIDSGKSIRETARKLGIEYKVVQEYLWQVGKLPWQGAKKYIALRLSNFKTARTQSYRQQLDKEIREQVDYLYYAARRTAVELNKIKKAQRKPR